MTHGADTGSLATTYKTDGEIFSDNTTRVRFPLPLGDGQEEGKK